MNIVLELHDEEKFGFNDFKLLLKFFRRLQAEAKKLKSIDQFAYY